MGQSAVQLPRHGSYMSLLSHPGEVAAVIEDAMATIAAA